MKFVAPWFLMIFLALALAPAAALAQVADQEPYRVEAGPYNIAVLANPSSLSLGTVQYMVRVTNARDGQPVPDARVVIRSRHGEEGGGGGWANALNTPVAQDIYEAVVQLDGPGLWEMSIDVSSELGRVEVEIPSQNVPVPRQSREGGMVFMGVFAALVLGGAYLVWASRRAQRQREAANAG
jgi:hypothetical protein